MQLEQTNFPNLKQYKGEGEFIEADQKRKI